MMWWIFLITLKVALIFQTEKYFLHLPRSLYFVFKAVLVATVDKCSPKTSNTVMHPGSWAATSEKQQFISLLFTFFFFFSSLPVNLMGVFSLEYIQLPKKRTLDILNSNFTVPYLEGMWCSLYGLKFLFRIEINYFGSHLSYSRDLWKIEPLLVHFRIHCFQEYWS